MHRRPWRSRSQVEWVDLYTRQSLFAVHAALVLLLLLANAPDRQRPLATALVAAGGLALNLVAALVARPLMVRPGDGRLPRRTLAGFVGLLALADGLVLLLPRGEREGAALMVWVALTFGLGALRERWALPALVVALPLVPWLPTGSTATAVYGLLAGLFVVFTLRSSLWLLGVVTELDRARGAQAALAVAEERLRFSRDVHDVLGRRLSTIAVQSELAATLAGRGDDRAARTMLEVRSTAHEALREARELARGYRPTSLAQELDGARSLLRSAGIDLAVDLDRLPAAWQEPTAWVVREAVTNVLRHSAATRVTVACDGRTLVVGNDRPQAPGTPGSGLTGLAERLAPLGATLAAERTDDAFTLTVVLPAAAAAAPDPLAQEAAR